VAFTNGCFDLLHAGHVRLLEDCAAQADRLIVGLNSDDSITRLKGPQRPLMPSDQRVTVLASLECINAVVVFEEDTPLSVIETVRPDILVKGGDYTVETVVGSELVMGYGGEVVLVPLVQGLSTTRLADAIGKL
jgi:D-beta-D-heptose 7-phosphate kinase/D-beta-D-heptose 1-phosphate adenosyltransferase